MTVLYLHSCNVSLVFRVLFFNEKQRIKSTNALGNKAMQSSVYKNWSFFGGSAGGGSGWGGGNQNQGGGYSIQKRGCAGSGITNRQH